MVGLEPTATHLQGESSTTELHRHYNSIPQGSTGKNERTEREKRQGSSSFMIWI